MKLVITIMMLLTVICSTTAVASLKECSREEAMQAETEASSLGSWDDLFVSYQRYSHCDDGAISEGYSEAVGRLLAKDWEHFGRLFELARKHKSFEKFVIHHVDETVPSEYLQEILKNTKQHCPSNAKRFCHAIAGAAE